MQEALSRQMVKMHVRECLRRADGETRTKFNAISADEAWRRADSLRLELERGDVAHESPSRAGEASLKERQREAAMRCQQQAMGKAPKPQRMSGRPPLSSMKSAAAQARPCSPRPSSPRRTMAAPRSAPGRVVRQSSPRPPSSRRRPASPRTCGGAGRPASRVLAPPGGHSSIVFG